MKLNFLNKVTIEKKQIGILYIATGKYVFFWDAFFNSAEKNFLLNHEKKYFVFTDQPEYFSAYGSSVVAITVPHLPWPYPTLYRFKFFLLAVDHLKNCDYLYFFNSNMVFLDKVGEEILPKNNQKLVGINHPGYFRNGNKQFPYERNPLSTAYIKMGDGDVYCMGALIGGCANDFMEMTEKINKNIEEDEKSGIIALWHDESHLNKYMLTYSDKLILDPRYGYPEGWLLWIGKAKIQIIDKAKNGGHHYFRS